MNKKEKNIIIFGLNPPKETEPTKKAQEQNGEIKNILEALEV